MIIVIVMKIIALIIITVYDFLFDLRVPQLPPALIFLVLSHTSCSVFKG